MLFSTPKLATGMIVGKFMPPHAGHLYLLEFAKNLVHDLTVLIDPGDAQIITPALRLEWLKELVPGARVIMLSSSIEKADGTLRDDAGKIVSAHHMDRPDLVFGANELSLELAAQLGATYVPVDDLIVPISSAQIRNAPLAHWERIPRCVRPHYVKRVCIFGPESTGKSTLTKNLAKHFNSVAVPEYARVFLDSRKNVLDLEEFKFYARGQLASEDALARSANRVLFCDTDALTTLMWSDWLFKHKDDWIQKIAEQRQYDLYLLTDVDVPWVADPQRYLPDERKEFFDYCAATLKSHNRSFTNVNGSWEERFNSAVQAVNAVLQQEPQHV